MGSSASRNLKGPRQDGETWHRSISSSSATVAPMPQSTVVVDAAGEAVESPRATKVPEEDGSILAHVKDGVHLIAEGIRHLAEDIEDERDGEELIGTPHEMNTGAHPDIFEPDTEEEIKKEEQVGHLEIIDLADYSKAGCNRIGMRFYHKVSFSISWQEHLYSGQNTRHQASLASVASVARIKHKKFAEAISAVARGLPPADCNLFKFPLLQPKDDTREAFTPTEDQISILGRIFKALVHHPIFEKRDATGACITLALLVANTPHSVGLCMELFQLNPKLLLLAHDNSGRFLGENVLHILAVNRRQRELSQALAIAASRLSKEERKQLLTQHACGPFFSEKPRLFYGSTPVAFMAVFGCRVSLQMLLNDRRIAFAIDLNQNECRKTGFLPIHAVVACGSELMYDFLISKKVPPVRRANAQSKIRVRSGSIFPLPLNPLQLAVRMGNQRMCLHVIKAQCCAVTWVWGPTTRYKLDLMGIDSSTVKGRGGGVDVMELIGRPNAPMSAREMLLDDFMNGLLHDLFRRKWRRFARWYNLMLRAFDTLLLALQFAIAFNLKQEPERADRVVLPIVAIFTVSAMTILELRTIVVWYKANSRQQRNDWEIVQKLCRWLGSFNVYRKMTVYVISFVALLLILRSRDDSHPNGEGDEPVWGLLGIANFLLISSLLQELFVPWPTMGVFAIIIESVIPDTWVWVVFNSLYVIAFWSTLYILYPRAGAGILDQVEEFNSLGQSFKTAWDVGFHVSSFEISFEDFEHLAYWAKGVWCLFALTYYSMMLMIAVLLIRLLMAMLTARFNRINAMAQLEWRHRLAQHVLRAELMWPLGNTWAVEADPFDVNEDGQPKHYVYLTEEMGGSAKSIFQPKQDEVATLATKVNAVSLALQAANVVILEQERLLNDVMAKIDHIKFDGYEPHARHERQGSSSEMVLPPSKPPAMVPPQVTSTDDEFR